MKINKFGRVGYISVNMSVVVWVYIAHYSLHVSLLHAGGGREVSSAPQTTLNNKCRPKTLETIQIAIYLTANEICIL